MIRSTFVLLLFSFLVGCYRQGNGVVVPYDHPANPYARPAPPIAVAPDVEAVAPQVGEAGAKPAPEKEPPSPGSSAAPHQHH